MPLLGEIRFESMPRRLMIRVAGDAKSATAFVERVQFEPKRYGLGTEVNSTQEIVVEIFK
jgi:hypothetical protein